ncbi:hypothetical protein BIZ35_15955 [Heyndrickxia coagulans]|nr:hypothetical protein BIZ35_15955 [Heyndrickxia coagulans]
MRFPRQNKFHGTSMLILKGISPEPVTGMVPLNSAKQPVTPKWFFQQRLQKEKRHFLKSASSGCFGAFLPGFQRFEKH